jgi:putative salt-induced outer membrane protein YdiY
MFLVAFPALGEDEVKKSWKNQAELSYVLTQGNSEVETFQVKDKQTNNYTENLSSELKLESFYSKALDKTTAERYLAKGRMDYKLGSKFSTALQVGWKKDVFSGVDNRYFLGPLLVYRFIDGPRHFLKTEAGLDYVYEEYTEADPPEDDFLSAGLYGEYEWILSEKVKFSQSVEAFRDFNVEESYQIESITALTTKLNSYFSFKTSYQVNHNTDPIDEDIKKTDSILTLALVADF